MQGSGEPSWYRTSVTAVRYLLGAQYLVSGLGWWIPMLPFPNVWNWMDFPQKHPVAGEMIATGWMYHLAKAIEVLAGVSLLSNFFVPLMLVVSFSIALSTFLLDAMIGRTVADFFGGRASFGVLRAKILDMIYFGGAVLAMQGYLMLAYLHVYKPMLAAKVDIEKIEAPAMTQGAPRMLTTIFAVAAVFLAVTSSVWMIGMINHWLIPWSTLAILAPPR